MKYNMTFYKLYYLKKREEKIKYIFLFYFKHEI